MNILVGTLYCGEREFDRCAAAIRAQTGVTFAHRVYRDLPNRAAHDRLFRDFLDAPERFDLLVKVDADMVLARPDLLATIARRFEERPALDLLAIAVRDWLSERPIMGLNTYRRTIAWTDTPETLFVDTKPLVVRGDVERDWQVLAPAAAHADDPNPLQALHYGLHRGLKAMQPDRDDTRREHWRMREHWALLGGVASHYRRTGDSRPGLAVLGAELAFAGLARPEHADYAHPELRAWADRWAAAHPDALRREIRRLRVRTWGGWPEHMRQAWLWHRHRRRRWGLHALSTLAADLCRERRPPVASGGGGAS